MGQTRRSGPLGKGRSGNAVSAASVPQPHLFDRAPAGYATAYAPSGRRRRWAAILNCPVCPGHHLVFARELTGLSGIRRSNCGNGKVWVVISKVHRVPEAVSDVAA